jgi:pro-apoptotic serine protease NMA111
MRALLLWWWAAISPAQAQNGWEEVLEEVVPAVVSIKVTGTRDFDTEDAKNSQGTGFVVDKERGIVLTNRHMVHAGPVVAEAVFQNQEEVELAPIYRDPVHDFGFYRFDPTELDDMELAELQLDPHGAKVGVDIRVIGNDSGEKLSILDGTIARLDRNAPTYGGNTYNDFNTFYIQAASNTSGGSSGSPVVDQNGNAVALNAGGKSRAASSYYLPLHRVIRALKAMQAGETPARGTLQTVFGHKPFDELARLGLSRPVAKTFRADHPDALGMLVIKQVLPLGPAFEQLRTGDVLLRINGKWVPDFITLEAALDDTVGQAIEVEVDRAGAAETVSLTVGDLHAITPDEFLEVGRGVVHPLSYQQARNHKVPVKGVYVAVPGYSLASAEIPEGAIITHVDGEPTFTLDAFEAALLQKADTQRVRLRFFMVQDPRHAYETVASMDRRWFAMRRCKRDDETGVWPCSDEQPPPPLPLEAPPEQLPPHEIDDKVANKVGSALVLVDFDIPYPTAGVKDRNFVGVGTIVDAERGLVLVDRDTVPVGLGDMVITIADTVRVPGKIAYLHPIHNFAVIRYDPAAVGDAPVTSVPLASTPARKGDAIWQVGLNRDEQLVSKRTTVRKVDTLMVGLSATPRFRDANVETVEPEDAVGSLGGMLVNKKGELVALWASFLDQRDGERSFHGLPASFIAPVLLPLQRGEVPVVRWIGAEFRPIKLSKARDRGVSDGRLRQLIDHDPQRRKGLEVARVTAGTAAEVLEDADILVAVNGEPVTHMGELEALHDQTEVEVTVVRNAEEVTVTLPTTPLSGRGTDRVLQWAGMLAHDSHHEVAAQQGLAPKGAYIAWMWYGSPASRYGLRPTRRIVAVNDQEIADLDSLIEIVKGMGHRESVRVRLAGLDGSEPVQTLKLDLHYWPTELLEWSGQEWIRKPVGE